MKENSTINVNLALKFVQNCKLKDLIEEDIGSDNPHNIEKNFWRKNLMKCFNVNVSLICVSIY